jgi:hypothetical protein
MATSLELQQSMARLVNEWRRSNANLERARQRELIEERKKDEWLHSFHVCSMKAVTGHLCPCVAGMRENLCENERENFLEV